MIIGLVGYGRMGKAIEALAIKSGFEIAWIIQDEYDWERYAPILNKAQIAIEFTHPESAYRNLDRLMEKKIATICGTTGWLDHYPYIVDKCLKKKGAFLYASNFSVGVNILFELNKQLAKWTNYLPEFKPSLHEKHHIHKLDHPSGTALTLLNDLIQNNKQVSGWKEVLDNPEKSDIPVTCTREGDIYGIHEVSYRSDYDLLQIRHEALSRDGFALGALIAAQWLLGRQGVYNMKDVLRLS
jgi:4-hydroxy-tetrahydrodipicolinate reductase